jgi:hypothetical protein
VPPRPRRFPIAMGFPSIEAAAIRLRGTALLAALARSDVQALATANAPAVSGPSSGAGGI